MRNYRIKISIQNVDTAHEVILVVDNEILKKKLTTFNKNFLNKAVKQVASALDDTENLQGKNREFLSKFGKK